MGAESSEKGERRICDGVWMGRGDSSAFSPQTRGPPRPEVSQQVAPGRPGSSPEPASCVSVCLSVCQACPLASGPRRDVANTLPGERK